MGLDEYQRQYSCRGFVLAVLLMGLGIVACMISLYAFVDESCVRAARHWLPPYPDATMVDESHTFLRVYGIGTTRQEFRSPDDSRTVSNWYRASDRVNGEIGRQRFDASMRWRVTDAEDGGSIITLSSVCAQTADLSSMGI